MEKVVSGTGHRPNKLGGYGADVFRNLVSVAMTGLRETEAEKAISGGALGWDQALAVAAIRLKLPLTLALPFEEFDCKWPTSSREYFAKIVARADEVFYVCEPSYANWKMQKRNVWMVDNSDEVLALWNGSTGGTGNCIDYANKVGRPIHNMWDYYKPIMLTGEPS